MPPVFKNKHHEFDPVWHVQIVLLIAIVLQLSLPNRFLLGSSYIMPIIECVLMLSLSFTTPKRKIFQSIARQVNVMLLIAATVLANTYSLATVANELLKGAQATTNGRSLIITAVNIYLTNIIIFALLYWEIDGGGPGHRTVMQRHELDFWFPQKQDELYKQPDWRPTFIDYLYVSSTNAMAFSPTDTLPLTRRAKMLMLIQATISIIAVALVAARAVNILS